MTKHLLDQLAKWLKQPSKIVIIPHKNPDGDAMGSSLAWYHLLTQLGHTTIVISPNAYPSFLYWMPGHEDVLFYDNEQQECEQLIASADLIFTMDFNTLKRIDDLGNVLEKVPLKKL